MSSGPYRLPAASLRFGRLIDRAQPLGFSFNGRRMVGAQGDTLASALMANGVRVIGSSPRYQRPRGIYDLGGDDPHAVVNVGTGARNTPYARATDTLLHEGLSAASHVHVNSRLLDFSAKLGIKGSIGERLLRRTPHALQAYFSAQPPVPDQVDPDHYEHMHVYVDVLVVGGGLAGLAAAEAAASERLSVLVAEETPRLGGMADGYEGRIDGTPLLDWTRNLVGALGASGHVHLLTRTTVLQLGTDGMALAVERVGGSDVEKLGWGMPRERLWHIHARAVVLATGAREKGLAFPDNDRPGIMLAAASRLYLRRYAVSAGRRPIIVTAGDEGYRTALDLQAAGVAVERVVDVRLKPDGAMVHMAKANALPLTFGSAPVGISTTKGGRLLDGITLANRLILEGLSVKRELFCDSVLVSGGWKPEIRLAAQIGARIAFDPVLGAQRIEELPRGVWAAGGANGLFDAVQVVPDGWRAGEEAVAYVRGSLPRYSVREALIEVPHDDLAEAVEILPDLATPAEKAASFLNFSADITAGDIPVPPSPSLGLTSGTCLGVLAGATRPADFRAGRRGALHELYENVLLGNVGGWNIPLGFLQGGERLEDAVRRETQGVRQGVGISDASAYQLVTVSGPGALRFLDWVLATDISELAVGAGCEALLLGRDGHIFEHVRLLRVAEFNFLLCAEPKQGQSLAAWLKEHHAKRSSLRTFISDESERWGKILVAGKRAQEVLRHFADLELSAHLHAGIKIEGVAACVLATETAGCPGFLLLISAGHAPALWRHLLKIATESELEPFGFGAYQRLRLEAAFMPHMEKTRGTVAPQDCGLEHLVSQQKVDFVGKNGWQNLNASRTPRLELMGLSAEGEAELPPAGTHLVQDMERPTPHIIQGYVLSSGFSPALRKNIALALVPNGRRRLGEDMAFQIAGGSGKAGLVTPAFLADERIKA